MHATRSTLFAKTAVIASFLLATACGGDTKKDNNNDDSSSDSATSESGSTSVDPGSDATGDTGSGEDTGSETVDTADSKSDQTTEESGSGSDSVSTGDSTTDSSSTDSTSSTTDEGGDWARDIELTDLQFNQGIAVPVAAGGEFIPEGERDIHLVKDRPGLFRASWALGSGFKAREIEARLTLSYDDGTSQVLKDKKMISGEPDLEELDGTFAWKLTADDVKAGMSVSVGLYETGNAEGDDPATPPRIPADGVAELGVPPDDMILEITFVPVEMNGKVPDFSQENLDALVAGYFNMNPVSEVRMTLHEQISVGGSSIDGVLSATSQLRTAEDAAPQMYYIGLASVDVTGWSGVSNLPGESMSGDRSSASPISNTPADYPSDNSWGYTVHETGHAQGRPHNPGCGAPGVDPDWPFGEDDTKIHIQGYDVTYDLLRPESSEDYMNYCFPDWQSAFTWEKTYTRINLLSSWSRRETSVPATYMLRGVINQEAGTQEWWAQPGSPDHGRVNTSTTYLAITLPDGEIVQTVGTSQESCSGYSVVEAELPTHPSQLEHIAVHIDNKSYEVQTTNLTAGYDNARRKYLARTQK